MQAAGPGPWPGGCGSGGTTNAFPGRCLDAADIVALTRLDDDRARYHATRYRHGLPSASVQASKKGR